MTEKEYRVGLLGFKIPSKKIAHCIAGFLGIVAYGRDSQLCPTFYCLMKKILMLGFMITDM